MKLCENCGTLITGKRAEHPRVRFCCDSCKRKFNSRILIEKKRPAPRVCPCCRRVIDYGRHGGNTKVCRECRAKGGKTELEMRKLKGRPNSEAVTEVVLTPAERHNVIKLLVWISGACEKMKGAKPSINYKALAEAWKSIKDIPLQVEA